MLQKEKLLQAKEIMKNSQSDVWITLVRETAQTPDPVIPLLSTVDYTWLSAIMFTNSGRAMALVGNHDEEGIKQMGLFDEVYSYQEDFTPVFSELIHQISPTSIAINYSEDFPAADGLSHGLYLRFVEILNSIGFEGKLVSSADIIRRLRGQKTPSELHLIKDAVHTAQTIFDAAASIIRPGMSEKEIYAFFHHRMQVLSVSPAWLAAQCPGVMAGPLSAQGHNGPTDIRLLPGDVMTIDFGVEKSEYCSDLQRVYYVPESSDNRISKEVETAFHTVRSAVEEAAKFIKPGVTGFETDAVARNFVTSRGYPEWTYALGHEVGRNVHDGGTILGPHWARYKGSVDLPLLEGNVFTLELGVPTSHGYVGLEEMVVVTSHGAEFLSTPQQFPYIL